MEFPIIHCASPRKNNHPIKLLTISSCLFKWKMTRNNNIQEELLTISLAVAQIENSCVYAVPVGYFDDFAALVLAKINSGAEPVYHFPKGVLYNVPGNYFENLAENILKKIKHTEQANPVFEELETVAPLLNTISKEPVYDIPKGYFDTVKSPQSQQTKPAKMVAFGFAKIYQYAVAAVVTGVLAVGIFLLLDKENQPLQAKNKPKTEVNNLSEDDIAEFLSNGTAGDNKTTVNVSASVYNADVQTAVKDISDEEINQFLQETEAHEGI